MGSFQNFSFSTSGPSSSSSPEPIQSAMLHCSESVFLCTCQGRCKVLAGEATLGHSDTVLLWGITVHSPFYIKVSIKFRIQQPPIAPENPVRNYYRDRIYTPIGSVFFRNGSLTGTALLTVRTGATAGDVNTVNIPQDGILYKDGAFVTFDETQCNSATVYFDG